MAETDDLEIIHQSALQRFYKKFFFAIAIICVYAILKMTFMATKDAMLDVAVNCEFEVSEEEYYYMDWVRDRNAAFYALSRYVNEEFTYIDYILEPCGDKGAAVYYFNTSLHTYKVCEEGTIQKYVEVCRTKGFFGRSVVFAVNVMDFVF